MISGWEWLVGVLLLLLFLGASPKLIRKLAWEMGRARKVHKAALKKPLSEEEIEEFTKEEEEEA